MGNLGRDRHTSNPAPWECHEDHGEDCDPEPVGREERGPCMPSVIIQAHNEGYHGHKGRPTAIPACTLTCD